MSDVLQLQLGYVRAGGGLVTAHAPAARVRHEFGTPVVAALRDEIRRCTELRDAFDAEIFIGLDYDEPEGSPASRRVDFCVARSIDLDHYIARLERRLRVETRATGEAVMPR